VGKGREREGVRVVEGNFTYILISRENQLNKVAQWHVEGNTN